MTKLKITYIRSFPNDEAKAEEVEAETWVDTEGTWIDFFDYEGSKVLRVRASDIERIERMG